MNIRVRHLVLSLAFLAGTIESFSQDDVRTSIDKEREGLGFSDDKTLEKARAFIRRDSTYYVGHMYQGIYFFFRANDALGFTKAIAPLKKAFQLMEKEFDQQLRVRTSDYYRYSGVYRYHRDYGFIAYYLERSYQNVEKPDKAFEVLSHVVDRNFQVEQGITSYNTLAWIFHRNRVYTSKQFPFLKNSVRDNVNTASRYLDSALKKNYNDYPINNGLFDPGFLNQQYLGTYHYKAMILDYKLEVDSANYFYNALIEHGAYSSNNYAEFKLAMGELEEADYYFKEAEERESGGGEKRTKEYYYMRGTLDTYRGHPEEADTLLRRVLEQQGSTPGFGWHCIGLARALHYEGLTEESQERAEKASRFQELHIGTTWGQEQYNLAVASLKYINQLQLEQEYLFENDQWWFWLNPVNWYRSVRFSMEIHHHKLMLASLVAENPEREQVIYSVFASENLVNFDEVWSVIDGFGNEYFIKVYKKMLATDKRPRLKKYFRYFLGKLYLADGDEDEAEKYFKEAFRDEETSGEYQVLLRARLYEGLAHSSSGSERDEWIRSFYEAFPQLVPFSGLEMEFGLRVDGNSESEFAKDVLDDLDDSALSFTSSEGAPIVHLSFSESDGGFDIRYSVQNRGDVPGPQGVLHLTKDEKDQAGRLLAYRLFGIEKKVPVDKPEQAPVPVQPTKPV